MDTKRILIIIASLRHGGGAEKVATTLGTELSLRGYRVDYLTFYGAEKKYPYLGNEYCLDEKFSTNFISKIWKFFYRAYVIHSYIHRCNIDCAISFMEESNFSTIISKIIFRARFKSIVSIRVSIESWGYLYRLLIRLLYNHADAVVPITIAEKDNLINNYGINPQKIYCIVNPIDFKKVRQLSSVEVNNMGGGGYKFITIGRLVPQKNHEYMIRSFLEFNKEYTDSKLYIIGEGPEMINLIELSKSNDNIVFLGRQDNVYAYLARSDCFLFTSKYEGMPGVILEAMACGLPVISTDCPTGPSEILGGESNNDSEVISGRYGLLIPITNNVDVLKNAMKMLYLDRELSEIYKKKSIERSMDYEINDIITKWEELVLS